MHHLFYCIAIVVAIIATCWANVGLNKWQAKNDELAALKEQVWNYKVKYEGWKWVEGLPLPLPPRERLKGYSPHIEKKVEQDESE